MAAEICLMTLVREIRVDAGLAFGQPARLLLVIGRDAKSGLGLFQLPDAVDH